jgi:hypothetical protein
VKYYVKGYTLNKFKDINLIYGGNKLNWEE